MEPTKLYIRLTDNDRLGIKLKDKDRLHLSASDLVNYVSLLNKPSINGVVLIGDKTSADIGLEFPIHRNPTAIWNAEPELIGQLNHIYIYTDYLQRDDKTYPGIKIGDGNAYLIDSPFINEGVQALYDHIDDTHVHITEDERDFWNNKITCYLNSEDQENLILSKDAEVTING